MRPANETRCYNVTGWAHAQNDPWVLIEEWAVYVLEYAIYQFMAAYCFGDQFDIILGYLQTWIYYFDVV